MAYKQTPLNMGSSPLKGNYESGVDGIRYVSTAPAFQDMQNKIAGGTAKAIKARKRAVALNKIFKVGVEGGLFGGGQIFDPQHYNFL